MSSPLNALLKVPAGILEMGLVSLQTAMKGMQLGLDAVTGKPPAQVPTSAQLEGPKDMDTAVSEFANRLAMIVRRTPLDEPESMAKQMVSAAAHCFGFLDLKDPRNIAVPLQMALSAGTLMTQQALRGIASLEVVGPELYPRFVGNVIEMFAEIQLFVSLQYKDQIEIYKKRLETHPDDAHTRYELGVIYNKIGLYEQAAEVLIEAAKSPAYAAKGWHEAGIGYYRSGQAMKCVEAEIKSLEADPGNDRGRMLLWLAVQRLGGYPESVPESMRMEVRGGWEKPDVVFENISAKAQLDKTSAGRGLAIFDYDNDGYLDIVQTAAHGGCTLFRNNGDGTFSDVSIESKLDTCVNGFVVTAGDYNNDGHIDLYVTRLGFFYGEGNLYRNNGDGTFTDVTKEAGVGAWGPAFTASWADYDNDGYLDLFVANNLGGLFDRKVPNRLFHNNGDGTFTEVSEKAGLYTMWPTIGSAWGDYNNDGYPDLFLSNAMGRSQLFRNNGDGTFTDVSVESGIASDYCIGSTAFWCDIDNDGWLDIVQFAWSDHENVIHTLRHGYGPENGRPLRVFRNNRDGSFTNISAQLGINGCFGTMSGNAGDWNNDGSLDLILGNGSPRMDRLEPMILLERQADGKFHNTTFAAGLPFTGKGHGGNCGDLFGDGRLSVLIAAGGAYPGDLLTTGVYCPKELPGNYLNVRLVGTKSNRDALGARIKLEAGGKKQWREVSGGTNFGCLPTEQHFGLADIDKVDAVEIRWPSGLQQRIEKLPVNKTIRITEGQDAWEDVYEIARARKAEKPASASVAAAASAAAAPESPLCHGPAPDSSQEPSA